MLYIWSLRHPASGYVQGFNDLCIPFLCVFLAEHAVPLSSGTFLAEDVLMLPSSVLDTIEADVYYCLNKVLAQIQDNYTAKQPGCVRMLKQL